ncbi:hypothetical protein [Kitasatospora viridis]|uniref:Uncharacterized protein n=1 Tax=Kitasatospora viridis TaxID=281105 RepID=A0A561S9J0_9ACTN|nr:hypothetical protein [Kitasatospora viridis]TWF71533.1 hypothetical protein FHX73_19163 [Kitasatospora viridis]
MTYQLDTARVTIDARLLEAKEYRVARALQLMNRAERTGRRARRALTSLIA